MKKLICCLLLFAALCGLSAHAAKADADTPLWPAYDPETGLWGYITEDGAWGIEPQWERAYHFHGGCAIVDTMDVPSWEGKCTQGIIDVTGAYLLEPAYHIDDACCLDGAGELYLVNQYDDERGSGWFNIPNRYFSGLRWTECYATRDTPYILVNMDYELDGLADRATGEIVVPIEYSSTGLYDWGIDGGFIVAEREDTRECELIEIGWGVVELPEGVVIDYYPGVSEGLIAFEHDGLYGYLNTEGEIVIPAQYDSAEGFMDGYAEVGLLEEVGTHAIIDRSGNIVLTGIGGQWQPGYYGVVDGALFVVWPDGAWGLIELDGTVRCRVEAPEGCYNPWLYQFAEDGPLWVTYEMEDEPWCWGIVDSDGQWLTEPGLNVSFDMGEPWLAVSKDGRWGYVDAYGNTILPFIYEEAGHFEDALARVKFDASTEGYINRSGEVVYQWPVPEQW